MNRINLLKNPQKKATVYANQWRFRSTNNLVHNADFFFNNGSLDGNELIRQMIQVVVSYEFIGVKNIRNCFRCWWREY